MAETIGTAYIQIEPTTQGIGGKIANVLDGEATKAGTSAGSKLSGALGSALSVGGAAVAGIATAFVGATTAVVNGAKATSEYGDNIDKTSQKLGLSNKAFQEWDYVMNLAGTSMNNMGTGLKTLTNKLDDAKNGSEKSQEMFKALGLSMEDLGNMSREEVFGAVIEGFQGMSDSTERAALANDLFGKSGQELTPLFNTTSEETKKLIQDLNDMGGIMSDDAVKASADFQDALTTMKASFGGVTKSMLSEFLPSMTKVMDGLGKVATGDDSGLGQIKEGIKDFITNLTNVLPEIIDVGVSIVESLGEAILDNLDVIVDSAIDLMDKLIDTIVDNLPEIIEKGIEIVVKLIVGISKAIPKLVEKAPDIIKAIVRGLVAAWPELRDAGIDMVEGIWNGIKSAWSSLKEKVKGLAGELVNSVKNFFKIGSPSKLFRDEVGQWIPAGIAVGIEGNTDALDDSMKVMQNSLDPSQLDVSSSYAVNYNTSSGNDGVLALLNEYLPQLANMQIVTDTGVMVGALAPKMDKELGRMASMRSRFV